MFPSIDSCAKSTRLITNLLNIAQVLTLFPYICYEYTCFIIDNINTEKKSQDMAQTKPDPIHNDSRFLLPKRTNSQEMGPLPELKIEPVDTCYPQIPPPALAYQPTKFCNNDTEPVFTFVFINIIT